MCSFPVRWHAHIDFQLFSQESSGIPGLHMCMHALSAFKHMHTYVCAHMHIHKKTCMFCTCPFTYMHNHRLQKYIQDPNQYTQEGAHAYEYTCTPSSPHPPPIFSSLSLPYTHTHELSVTHSCSIEKHDLQNTEQSRYTQAMPTKTVGQLLKRPGQSAGPEKTK